LVETNYIISCLVVMFDGLGYRDLIIILRIHLLWFWSYEIKIASVRGIYAEIRLMIWLLWVIGLDNIVVILRENIH